MKKKRVLILAPNDFLSCETNESVRTREEGLVIGSRAVGMEVEDTRACLQDFDQRRITNGTPPRPCD